MEGQMYRFALFLVLSVVLAGSAASIPPSALGYLKNTLWRELSMDSTNAWLPATPSSV